MKLLILNLLFAVAFFEGRNDVLAEQYGLAGLLQFYAGSTDAVNCTNVSGNICGINPEDCDSIFLCIPSMPDPIKAPCGTGLTCNEGVCSAVKSPVCEYGNRKFKCNSEGVYPEPSSCRKFNYCVPTAMVLPTLGNTLSHTESECTEGWRFNLATASCDKKLLNNECAAKNRPVPTCLTVGQNGALKRNPSMYYICMAYSTADTALYPSIFKCPGNTKYVGNYTCK